MLQRSFIMAGVILLGSAAIASASAQSREFHGGGFQHFSGPHFMRQGQSFRHRQFLNRNHFNRFESARFERREELFERRRFFDRNRFFFGYGGFPYYPNYTTDYPANYPYVLAVPADGPSANAASPLPPTQVGDLPPCRETTTEGVVIVRGTACTRNQR